MCPASGTGKTLSPMDLIVKMRDHLTEKGATVTSRSPWMPSYVFGSSALRIVDAVQQETAATVEHAKLNR